MNTSNFPKRFEIEGLNPQELEVVIVTANAGKTVFANLAAVTPYFRNMSLVGPMADKNNGKWCIRYEDQKVYDTLSN